MKDMISITFAKSQKQPRKSNFVTAGYLFTLFTLKI